MINIKEVMQNEDIYSIKFTVIRDTSTIRKNDNPLKFLEENNIPLYIERCKNGVLRCCGISIDTTFNEKQSAIELEYISI